MIRGLGARTLASSLLAALAFIASPPAFAGAPGHTRNTVEALEQAPVVVVGTFESVSPLAHSAHLGRLAIDDVVVGRDADLTSIELAWEEPGLTVPARHAPGDRVLVGLEPLPTASIWKQRVPDADVRDHLLAVASAGSASLARPSAAAIDLLRHYLGLAPDARRGEAGLIRLAQMTAGTETTLAGPALNRLIDLRAASDHRLPEVAANELVRALFRDDAPALVAKLVQWIGSDRPDALAAPLDRAMKGTKTGERPRALEAAHAAMNGGLPAERVAELIRSSDEEERVLAAQHARGDVARVLLPSLIATDPSSRVRAAAMTRWAEIAGANALPETLRALEDPSTRVRRAAVDSAAAIGEPALPELLYLAETGSTEGARMAVASLSMMGEPARPALADLAANHDDEGIRTLARIALGLPIGHAN